MNRFHKKGIYRWSIAAAVAVLVTSACATVSQDDFDAEMDRVRQELREGDEAVEARLSQRVDQVESRLQNQISSLETQLNQLRSDFDVTVERLEAAIRFNTPVHFAFDDDTVRPQHEAVLNRLAEVLRGYYADAVITVEGFTDPAGSADYNLRLGERRAEAVREYLAAAGIPSDRMRAVSYGQAVERQIAPGAQGPGEAGWQNRRVAVVIDFAPSEAGRPVAMSEPSGEGF